MRLKERFKRVLDPEQRIERHALQVEKDDEMSTLIRLRSRSVCRAKGLSVIVST